MKKIELSRFAKLILGIALLGGTAAMITSCGGINQTILDNQVNRGDGTRFSTDLSLTDGLKLAMESSSNTEITKDLTNQILYNWFSNYAFGRNDKPKIQSYNDNWVKWYDEAKSDWDAKVDQYKSDYKNDWEWYFQNEILDPVAAIGGSWSIGKDGKEKNNNSEYEQYIKIKMYDQVRSFFTSQVFNINYFGLPSKNAVTGGTTLNYGGAGYTAADVAAFNNLNYDPKLPGVINVTAKDVQNVMAHPGAWQFLDFYVGTDQGTNTVEKTEIGWQYAYLQHVAFNEYLKFNHPVATTMSLWKNTEVDKIPGGFESVYNKDLVPTDNQKTGWQFPYFADTGAQGPKEGPNTQFNDFVRFGFPTSSPKYFLSDYDVKKAGLIEVPVNGQYKFTDDSATIFKVNLASDAYTATFLPFAATIAELWDAFATGNRDMDSLPLYKSGTAGKVFPQGGAGVENPLLKNFLFTQPNLTNSKNPINASLIGSAAALGGANISDKSFATVGSTPVRSYLGQDLVLGSDGKAYSAKIFNNQSEWYRDSYIITVSGYQLSSAVIDPFNTSSAAVNNPNPLPFALIREKGNDDGSGSGVHFLGLDGVNYLKLTATESSTTSQITEGITVDTTPWSTAREGDIIKIRSFQDIYDSTSAVGDGFDVTATTVKDFFSSHVDELVIKLANASVNLVPEFEYVYQNKIFDVNNNNGSTKLYSNWSIIYNLSIAIFNFNLYINTQRNIDESQTKILAFTGSALANVIWKTPDPTIVNDDSVYLNGLSYNFPFKVSIISAWNGSQVLYNKVALTHSQLLAENLTTDLINAGYTGLLNVVQTQFANFLTSFNIRQNPTKSELNKYSERIFTTYHATNNLINAFAASSNFTNGTISNYYQAYANAGNAKFIDDTPTSSTYGVLNPNVTLTNQPTNFYTNVNEALKLLYYSSSVNTEQLNTFFTPDAAPTLDNYLAKVVSAWNLANLNNIRSSGSTERLNYLKLASSLRYLVTNKTDDFDPTNFINWLRKKMVFGDLAAFGWSAKEYAPFSSAFNTYNKTSDSSNLANYTWKKNYMDNFNNTFRDANATSTVVTANETTHITNASYYRLAKANSIYYNGYLGLVTDKNSSDANFSNIFSNNLKANPYNLTTDANTYTGSLYQYRQLSSLTSGAYDWINLANDPTFDNGDFKYSLFGLIASYRYDIASLRNLSTKLVNSIPNFEAINYKIQNDINFYTTGEYAENGVTAIGQAQGLINALYGLTDSNLDPNWDQTNNYSGAAALKSTTSVYFKRNTGLREVINPKPVAGSESLFREGTNYSRYAFLPIAYQDFLVNANDDALTPANARAVFSNLLTAYDPNLIYQLLINAAQDSASTSEVENQILTDIKNSKVTVYDRRMNDVLGKKWISNYKERN